jgi:hypothetical protein
MDTAIDPTNDTNDANSVNPFNVFKKKECKDNNEGWLELYVEHVDRS